MLIPGNGRTGLTLLSAGPVPGPSLGCVLYECLTGRVPFEKDLDAAIIWAHVEETPTMPTVLRPDLPPEIDDVFGRVLSKQPGSRYQSCREFIDAARMALGIFGRGTHSLAYGVTTTGLDASAPPGRHAGAPPDRYSWSSPPVHGYAADPGPPGGLAAASPSGPGQSWSSQPSVGHPGHGQPAAAPPPVGQPQGRAGTGGHAGSPCWRPWPWSSRAWAPGPG